jgi:hypothetical protein
MYRVGTWHSPVIPLSHIAVDLIYMTFIFSIVYCMYNIKTHAIANETRVLFFFK